MPVGVVAVVAIMLSPIVASTVFVYLVVAACCPFVNYLWKLGCCQGDVIVGVFLVFIGVVIDRCFGSRSCCYGDGAPAAAAVAIVEVAIV